MTRRTGSAALCAATLLVAACSGSASPPPHAATADVTEFKISLDAARLAAGEDSFSVRNDGTITHEFVVVRTDLAADALPKAADGGVDEEGTGVTSVDEVEDIAAGSTGSLTVTLPAGKYVVFCNLPGHYAGGMRAAFEVAGGS
jgi:uncharacterized cupredoxin-like copper-binding protein